MVSLVTLNSKILFSLSELIREYKEQIKTLKDEIKELSDKYQQLVEEIQQSIEYDIKRVDVLPDSQKKYYLKIERRNWKDNKEIAKIKPIII